MPRGVYHSALRGGNLRTDQGKTVAGIPGFMLKTYEKNKHPGLKPGLAGNWRRSVIQTPFTSIQPSVKEVDRI